MTSIVAPPKRLSSMHEARASTVLSNWKLTPATMLARLDPSWIPAKWLQYLSLKIAQAIARGNCGLLISAPPRHGKSKLSTIGTPMWVLENFPKRNVVVSTYGEELSTDFSREVRDTITNNQNLFTVRLRDDTRRVTNFLTTEGGGLKAVGLRGAITGRGADVFILDDYIKEPKEALSATYLNDLWTWWLTVARTRLEPGAVVIILATRWVPDDIHGRIMAQQTERGRNFFEYIEMPAIATTHDILGRKPGEVLFPERYSAQAILDLRDDLGTRWFNAMFQQRPDSAETSAINLNWFKLIKRSEFEEKIIKEDSWGHQFQWVRSWDLASTKDGGDFTAGVRGVYNKTTEEFYIDDVCRGQFSAARAELEFKQALERDYEMDANIKVGLEQEPGSSGDYTIRAFRRLAREVVSSVKLHPQRASTSKLLNAQPFLAAAEQGKVYIVTADEGPAPWQKALFEEFNKFPESEFDDQTDATVNAYKLASGKKGITASIGRRLPQSAKDPGFNKDFVQKGRSAVTFGRGSGARRLILPRNTPF